jgi:hypothetical protein
MIITELISVRFGMGTLFRDLSCAIAGDPRREVLKNFGGCQAIKLEECGGLETKMIL